MNSTILTFRELLRLSFAEPLIWLSDEPASDVLIHWAVLSVDEVQAGDVLLIPGADLHPQMVAQTRKRGGAAIILLGEASLGESVVPPKIPVVAVPGETNLRDVYRTVLTILINQRAYLMERGVRVHAQLSQLAADREGLIGLARAMFEISGRCILVQDKRLGVLAEFPSPALLSIWDDVLAQLTKADNLPEDLRDRKKAGKHTSIFRQAISGELERLITPISAGGVARGYLSLVDVAGTLDSLDYLVAEQGALVCAVEMVRAKAVREAEKRLKGDLLTALLHENITPRDANLWVQSMGFDLTQTHAAIRFAWDGPSHPSRRRLETLVNGEIARMGLTVLVRSMETEVVCFCQIPPGHGRPEVALRLGEAILAHGAQEFPDSPVCCGIGFPASDMGNWRDSFRQAGQALEMAHRLGKHKPLYFPDLSVYRLLLQLEYHPELQSFKREILGPLLAYEGGKELIRTLETYFDHNGNLSQAAEALFIHRNTLIYRMDRIAEISGLDLDSAETRLAIQLALRIHHMIDRD